MCVKSSLKKDRPGFAGVSIIEYALVLSLVVLPIIVAVNNPSLRVALQNVFTGTVNTQQTSGSLQLEAFGEN